MGTRLNETNSPQQTNFPTELKMSKAIEQPQRKHSTSTGTMKAFVMEGIEKVGFTDKPIPDVGPNDAVIKTTRALVCTSDVHTIQGAIGDRQNLTLGHEAVGLIHKLGSEVTGFKEGDRVLSVPSHPVFIVTIASADTRRNVTACWAGGSTRT